MIDQDLANKKVFSLNDLISMGLITQKQVEDYIRYQQAKHLVNDLFKGRF
jgi:hypothetical protein